MTKRNFKLIPFGPLWAVILVIDVGRTAYVPGILALRKKRNAAERIVQRIYEIVDIYETIRIDVPTNSYEWGCKQRALPGLIIIVENKAGNTEIIDWHATGENVEPLIKNITVENSGFYQLNINNIVKLPLIALLLGMLILFIAATFLTYGEYKFEIVVSFYLLIFVGVFLIIIGGRAISRYLRLPGNAEELTYFVETSNE